MAATGLNAAAACDALVGAIADLRRRVGLDRTLRSLGVSRSDVADLAQNALRDPCMATNPRSLDLREVDAFLEQAL